MEKQSDITKMDDAVRTTSSNGRVPDGKIEATSKDEGYPSGFKLVTIIVSLCLAVFMAALDMV